MSEESGRHAAPLHTLFLFTGCVHKRRDNQTNTNSQTGCLQVHVRRWLCVRARVVREKKERREGGREGGECNERKRKRVQQSKSREKREREKESREREWRWRQRPSLCSLPPFPSPFSGCCSQYHVRSMRCRYRVATHINHIRDRTHVLLT